MDSSFDISGFPPLPRTKGFFVTATDTEVGKTLVAGAIAANLRSRGLKVGVFKPAATGCTPRRESGPLVSADGEFLARCAGDNAPHERIVPCRHAAAVAPNLAAEREGRPVDVDAIARAYAEQARQHDCMVVEGVGGLLCPISDAFWVIHLARLCGLPLVVVARPGLGTINHTLLTLHAARSAGLSVAGVVINRFPLSREEAERIGAGEQAFDADLSVATNPRQIARLGGVPVLAVVPDDPESSVERAQLGPAAKNAIDAVDWLGLVGGSGRAARSNSG